MMKIMGGGEKKTLVEKARTEIKRARRKHQEALMEFNTAVAAAVPDVILSTSRKCQSRIDWDMFKSATFANLRDTNPYFLLGEDNLTDEEWHDVHDAVVTRLKAEPDLSWKLYDADCPSVLTLIWT